MFKKKPQIKNLSPLRSSDRRKLADQIILEFKVAVPGSQATDSAASDQPAPMLSTIRNSLLPENCSSARFTTHAGADKKLVSVGPGTQRLYPTVYTLWENPGLVPLLHTWDPVVDKLQNGADLMTPGLFGGPPWPKGAREDAIVAVATLEIPNVPIWVGVCKIDVSALGNVQGVKGNAVDGIHWAGDEVWTWSPSAAIDTGREPPGLLQGWGEQYIENFSTLFARLDPPSCEGLDEEDDEDALDGGVLLNKSGDQHDAEEEGRKDNDNEPTTQQIDDAFQEAFMYCLHNARKEGSPPYYGFDLPGIQPSYLIANMIQPHLRSQTPNYTIKKTSWKNTKKFIKHLDKQKLVKSKDRNGGETIILDIDFDDIRIKQFVPYRLPKLKADDNVPQSDTSNGASTSPSNQNLTIQRLYRASSKLVPDLIPSKTDYYSRVQMSDFIRTYVENDADLSAGVSSRRFIKLNPFIANNILGSRQTTSDTQILAKGEIARDALQKRVLDDDHLCIPFWVLLGSDQVWDPADRSLPKPKSGPSPKVTITIEKRTGTKTITTVTGLEPFNISPQVVGPELQKKCASSASVQQAIGLKLGMMEIMVQGDQREVVIKEIGKRGVKKEWFEIVDKTKKKGGK